MPPPSPSPSPPQRGLAQGQNNPGRSSRNGMHQPQRSQRNTQRHKSRRKLPRLPSVELHGTLHIEVGGARHLLSLNRGGAATDGGRDSDDGSVGATGTTGASASAPNQSGCLSSLVPFSFGGVSVCNPFVEVRVGNATMTSTTTLVNTLKPTWHHMVSLNLAHVACTVVFRVMDRRPYGEVKFLGELRLAATDVVGYATGIHGMNGFPLGRLGGECFDIEGWPDRWRHEYTRGYTGMGFIMVRLLFKPHKEITDTDTATAADTAKEKKTEEQAQQKLQQKHHPQQGESGTPDREWSTTADIQQQRQNSKTKKDSDRIATTQGEEEINLGLGVSAPDSDSNENIQNDDEDDNDLLDEDFLFDEYEEDGFESDDGGRSYRTGSNMSFEQSGTDETDKGRPPHPPKPILSAEEKLELARVKRQLPDGYFGTRYGMRWKMYQSAHQPGRKTQIEPVRLSNGSIYQVRSLWLDIALAIHNAKAFICVSSRLFDPNVVLVRQVPAQSELMRDPGESGNRDEDGDYESLVSLKGVTFGELLKRKAAEGVLVDILLWDAATGSETLKANIHDSLEQTTRTSSNCALNYFIHSTVRVALVPKQSRTMSGKVSHHQNSIVLDSPSMLSGIVLNIGQEIGKPSRIDDVIAFVGSLEIANGRYDTVDKSLFHPAAAPPLNKTGQHSSDFRNTYAAVDDVSGPRQPWHDVSTLVRGEAAVDVLKNFVERWTCQAGRPGFKLNMFANTVTRSHAASASDLFRVLRGTVAQGALPGQDPLVRKSNTWNEVTEEVVHAGSTKLKRPEQLQEMKNKDPSGDTSFFATQIVRSIDSSAARFEGHIGYPEVVLDGLNGTVKDESLCRALVHHIRRAQHFLYIEANQFVGGSFAWQLSPATRRTYAQYVRLEQQKAMQKGQERQTGSSLNETQLQQQAKLRALRGNSARPTIGPSNTIPMEITYKICEKIRMKKEFHVYIVLPLYPEGNPATSANQLKLFWQHQTIETMYKRIAKEIEFVWQEQQNTNDTDNLLSENAHPTDYLSIYALGQREPIPNTIKPKRPVRTADVGVVVPSSALSGTKEANQNNDNNNNNNGDTAAESVPATPPVSSDAMGSGEGKTSQEEEEKNNNSINSNSNNTQDEVKVEEEEEEEEEYKAGELMQARLLRTRRSPIAVNSRMLIVDDEVIVSGSGNFNDTSLRGDGDSELGVCVFEADRLASAKKTPRGEVFGFRMALWYEHLGGMLKDTIDFDESIVSTPGLSKCSAHVQMAAKRNWSLFVGKEVRELNGHLLLYPYVIAIDGAVTARKQFFPDSCEQAKVVGTYDPTIPAELTF